MKRLLRRLAAISAPVFTLDLRSLALFRVGLALVVVADVLLRVGDAEIFYTDAGVLPRSALSGGLWSKPSLHLLSGGIGFQLALFGLTIACALALLLGWRTRAATAACWLLVVSTQNRNGYINTGADAVLSVLLAIGVFLPLSARFSLDAKKHGPTGEADGAMNAATVVFVLQVILIYAFNVINKSGTSWKEGTAVLQALHIDQHATPLGVWLRERAPWLSPPLTGAIRVVEASAVLLLVPVFRDRVRLALVVAMWALHAGLAACLYLGLFSPVCMVAWLALLPARVWRAKARPTAPTADEPPPESHGRRRSLRLAAAVPVVSVFVLQLGVNLRHTVGLPLPRPLAIAASAFRLHQPWEMFAPSPARNDGWFLLVGRLASSREVDLFRGGAPVVHTKPRYVGQMYETAHWRKFMMSNSGRKRGRGMRPPFARWLCRSWNADHAGDERLVSVRIVFMREKTRRDFGRPTAVPETLLDHRCAP